MKERMGIPASPVKPNAFVLPVRQCVRCMLDFAAMAYWRKLLLVVLLILSLPVQSFAAVSMKCAFSHSHENVPSAEDAVEETPDAHHAHGDGDLTAAVDHAGHHHHGVHHQAHQCSTCASCCLGAALPVSPTVAASIAAVRFAPPSQFSVAVVRFLTDGIERPPRPALV